MLEIWELNSGIKQHKIKKMEETSSGSQDPARVVAQLMMMMMMMHPFKYSSVKVVLVLAYTFTFFSKLNSCVQQQVRQH
jgi:hypothetical protein